MRANWLDRDKIFLLKKRLYRLVANKPVSQRVLFIVGCQRSGTSMLGEIFQLDIKSRVFGEVSELSHIEDPKKLRLRPIEEVKHIINKQKSNLVVAKPIVESQHVKQYLDAFHGAKAIWIFRHYQDVVASNLKKFGQDTGIRDLLPIVEDDSLNWRSEFVSDEVRKTVCNYYSADMNFEDAAALFWYVRNHLYYDLNLSEDARVKLCKYEELVEHPKNVMRDIYQFAGSEYPDDQICRNVHSRSVRKGAAITLSPEVEELCNELYLRLSRKYSFRPEVK